MKTHDALVKQLESSYNRYTTIFHEIDSNKSGYLTQNEMSQYFKREGHDFEGLENTLKRAFQLDSDKKITLEGLIIFILLKKKSNFNHETYNFFVKRVSTHYCLQRSDEDQILNMHRDENENIIFFILNKTINIYFKVFSVSL